MLDDLFAKSHAVSLLILDRIESLDMQFGLEAIVGSRMSLPGRYDVKHFEKMVMISGPIFPTVLSSAKFCGQSHIFLFASLFLSV